METLNFSFSINSSLQIGDTLYYATDTGYGITGEPSSIGVVESIFRKTGKINYIPSGVQPLVGDFILFSKPIQVNESSLKGYYADVTFTNNSNKRAELFAVSSDIALSSK
mgnify:CR=1 FL=1